MKRKLTAILGAFALLVAAETAFGQESAAFDQESAAFDQESAAFDQESLVGQAYTPAEAGLCQGDTCAPSGCDSCGGQACRRCPKWTFYGEHLYLRPGNEKVSFGVPIDSSGPEPPETPIPIGREAVADIDFESGFRVGFARVLSSCSSLGADYTHFESDTNSHTQVTAPTVLRSLVFHPSTANAAADFLTAQARYDIDFETADVNYRRMLTCGPRHQLNWLAGVRYAHLQQDFSSVFTNATTVETIETDITFDGGGLRLGLEGERRVGCGLLVYGRGYASFVGGEFNTDYRQGDNFAGTVVDTGWEEDRVVSILDLELGVGWVSSGGRVRLSGGYSFSGWYDVIPTDELIEAVRTNDSTSVDDTLTFDGLVARAEVRY
ncbi:MAG: Lpg1974 family pore-forming outer membrane protein [Pirellulales bacterium]